MPTPNTITPFYSNAEGISKSVIEEKYCKDGEIKDTVAESKEAIYRRVAKGAAKAEAPKDRRKWERRFFKNMMENDAIGGGRIMSNVGTDVGGTAINCFVQGVGDSISITEDEKHPAIYIALMKAAESMRRGGGIGYNFSRIRPANAYVKGTSSSASGPCSYIDVFNVSCSTVESKGARRGAQLGTLVVSHPDIEAFIEAKQTQDRWSNFNVSVAVTDDFMEAVRNDAQWELVHKCRPVDELIDKGAYYAMERDVWVYSTVRAKDLWEKIMRATYDYAEPGILYIDTINRLNNLNYTEVIESTNPCVVGSTYITTKNGDFPIAALVGQTVEIWNGFEWSEVLIRETGQNQEIYTVVVYSGKIESDDQVDNGREKYPDHKTATVSSVLECTLYHKFILAGGNRVEATDLQVGDVIADYSVWKDGVLVQCTGGKVIQKIRMSHLADKVYCFTDPKNNSAVFNGILTANCGEQPLPPDGCCCLGPINLSNYVTDQFDPENAKVDFKRLHEAVTVQVRFLDNILDVTLWPHEEQRQEAMNKRRIGLGITGLDDMLKKLCLHYGDIKARVVAESVMRFIANTAYQASVDLAIEKGPFPLFDADKYLSEEHFVHRIDDVVKAAIREHGIRNSHLLSVAPTGTTSLAFFDGCAGGLEPTFDFGHNRRKRMPDGSPKTYFVAAGILSDYLNWLVHNDNDGIAAEIYNAYVTEDVKEIKRVRENYLPEYFVTALELSVDEHLEMVKVIQKWNDTACSKTVNVPSDYPYEDFKELYLKAHAAGLKGISTYRPNSVRKGILTSASDNATQTPTEAPTPVEETKVEEVFQKVEPLELIAKRLAAQYQSFYENFLSVKLEECPKGIKDAWRFYEKVHMEDGRTSQLGYVSYLSIEKYDQSSGYSVKFARPFEVSITSSAATSDWADFFGRALSNSARKGIYSLAEQLRTSRKVRSDRSPIRYKNIEKPDGSKVPRFVPSEPALLSFMVTETLIEQGLLNEEYQVAPLETLILKQLRRQHDVRCISVATDRLASVINGIHSTLVTQPQPDLNSFIEDGLELAKSQPVGKDETQPTEMTGMLCKECGANAVVKRDGCKFCENCGAEGSCG